MWQLFIPGFIMGLAGSLHCVGMCGPIAMALPLQEKTTWGKLLGSFLYNSGRVTTYAGFGLVFGFIGRSFAWFGWQQKISISLGIIILLFLVIPKLFPDKSLHPGIQKIMSGLRQKLSQYLFKGNPASLYATGLLNGLLPCGLVYMALAGATVAGEALKGSLFMMFFGLGTMPAMFFTAILGSWIKQPVRARIRKWYPAMMVLMATLLILRGLNLGIPLVSPKLNVSNSSMVECHPDDLSQSIK
jgi:sulfite exporter TauE/SafE